MLKVIIHGINGRMGKVVEEVIKKDPELLIAAGIDLNTDNQNSPYPIYSSASECKKKADVVIDFSYHDAVPNLLEYCLKNNTPVVIATTALSQDTKKFIKEASNNIPVFQSANMSVGISLVVEMLKLCVPSLEDNYNIEIIEKHHINKVDAPSGTALLLADTISESCKIKKNYVYGRQGTSNENKTTDLGIHAVRGGTIPSEHTIIFAGDEEVIEISHAASSRSILARGAVKAAKYIASAKPGLYNMSSLLNEEK